MTGFKDALLALSTYPDPTPRAVIDQSIEIASHLGARLTALAPVLDNPETLTGRDAWRIQTPILMEGIREESFANATELLGYFESRASRQGIYGGPILEGSQSYASAGAVVRHARQRDVTFIPIPELIGLDELYAEDVVFDSGRPVILLPAAPRYTRHPVELETIVIAWDGSRAAARAVGDALPILENAQNIRVLTVTGEKKIETETDDLERHLKMHGVGIKIERIDAGGQSIGEVLTACTAEADMLVMGAFGHSRLREFILGGATRAILRNPPLPVFLSH
jgi:nucleotide-binding universal stress UspA family protein